MAESDDDTLGLAEAATAGPGADGAAAPVPATGEVLAGRYEVLGVLGRGAFGVVLRARDRVSDTVVALKLLNNTGVRTPESMARVRRELQAAWKVTHPGVVRIYDLIDVGDRLALSMELVDGETLDRHLARVGRLDAEALTALTLDLARALAAAHRAGVTHRDLKPPNIILRAGTGRAVITDFGVSRLPGASEGAGSDGGVAAASSGESAVSLTRSGALLGTPLYMAPEQLLGRRDVGPPADMFALGLVLFEAATGSAPASSSSSLGGLIAERTKTPLRLAAARPDLPFALTSAIDRCLRADAAERTQNGAALRAELESLASSQDITGVHELPPPTAGERAPRRRRALWPLAALVVIAAIAGGIGFRAARRLPSHDRRVGFVVDADAGLTPALQAMAEHRLATDRRVRVVPAADANVLVRLSLAQTGDDVAIAAALGPSRARLTPLTTAHGSSVAAALEALWPTLRARLDDGQRERELDADERAELERWGGHDVTAYLQYRDVVDELFRTIITDVPALSEKLRAVIARDPSWLRPYLALAWVQGGISPSAEKTIAEARLQTARGRDDVGDHILATFGATESAAMARLVPIVDADYRAHPTDILCGWALLNLLYPLRRSSEALSLAAQLNERRPDLQFGSDLQQQYRYQGRNEEIPKLEERWLGRAPDNEQAMVAAVAVALEGGQPAVAETRARQILTLFGRSSQRLQILGDVLVATGSLDDAGSVTDQMLRGDAWSRAFAWYQKGQIALLQGRLVAAREAWVSASRESEPFGSQGPLSQSLEDRASLAEALGDVAERRRALEALEKWAAASGDQLDLMTKRVLLAGVTEPRRCPDIAAMIGGLTDELRDAGERQLTRAAATIGCARCEDVVRLGLSPYERSAASLFAVGACAEKLGNLELARDTFTRALPLRLLAVHVTDEPATVYAILSRYHLGVVLERMGQHAEARAELRRFLDAWGHVDRSLGEVADARRRLAAATTP